MSKLVAKLARKAADSGGAALMFHYPGFGDSTGRSESATVERMVEAARDAVVEASRRGPTLAWGLVGIRLGASIAALARRHAGVSTLLLVQPALDPTSYFDEVRWMARRANLGAEGISGYAFGYPIIHTVPSKLGDAVRNELSENPDGVVAVCYEHPAMNDPSLDQVDRITVAGRWQFGLKSYPELKEASVRGLQRVMGGRT
jgi:alpha-beta hydrolase superfamily lysophospholipase